MFPWEVDADLYYHTEDLEIVNSTIVPEMRKAGFDVKWTDKIQLALTRKSWVVEVCRLLKVSFVISYLGLVAKVLN